MSIGKAVFVTSVGLGGAYPDAGMAEIAMVGRSNVGKSSLINAICNNSKLAKTSQKPGKTRCINYFLINEQYYIVDLPGYGYANAPKSEIQKWGELIEGYLQAKRVTHIFLLLDIRHEPTVLDRQMYNWILYFALPYTIIATKADKLSRAQRQASVKKLAKQLGSVSLPICFSAQERLGIEETENKMQQIVNDYDVLRG